MKNINDKKLNIVLKWTNRIIATIGLIAIGIVILILRTTVLSSEVISVLITAIIAGLTYNVGINHKDVQDDIKTIKTLETKKE